MRHTCRPRAVYVNSIPRSFLVIPCACHNWKAPLDAVCQSCVKGLSAAASNRRQSDPSTGARVRSSQHQQIRPWRGCAVHYCLSRSRRATPWTGSVEGAAARLGSSMLRKRSLTILCAQSIFHVYSCSGKLGFKFLLDAQC